MLTARYLQKCADPAVELYGGLQDRIQADIARRIAGANYATETSKWQVEKLKELGASRAEINKAVAKLSGKSVAEVNALFKQGAAAGTSVEARIAASVGIDPSLLPNVKDKGIAAIVEDVAKTTGGTLRGITKTAAKDATRKLNQYLDAAYMDVSSGAFTVEQAVKTAVGRFAKDGVSAFDYESGRRYSIEGAVRTAIRTAMGQMSGRVTMEAGRKAGIGQYRVTEHADSRPEHADWQGGVYTEAQLSSVCGYGEVDGLKGINCRHDFYLYEDGVSEPPEAKEEYSPEVYEAEQAQRYNERSIRAWKREAQTLEAGGQDSTLAARKVRDWQAKQRELIAATKEQTGVDLARLYAREQVGK